MEVTRRDDIKVEEKEAFIKRLSGQGIKFRLDEPLAKYTTLNIGGPAEYFIEIRTIDELKFIIEEVSRRKITFFVIGAGSNLLINDSGLKGFVFKFKGDFEKLEFFEDRNECHAGSGVMLQFLMKRSIDLGLSGFQNLAGIPGTVGGALVMNAGTGSSSVSDIVKSVKTMDLKGSLHEWKRKEIKFEYRKSSLEGLIIVGAEFLLGKSTREEMVRQVTENLSARVKTQPLGTFNAGSIFKNPAAGYASKLIEACGMKGYSVGNAFVSEKHANFIINRGNATADDIYRLVMEIRKKVLEKFNLRLELEIKLIGF